MTKSPWWPLKLALVMVFWLSLIGVATQPRAQSAPIASSSSPTCHGKFPNIITDICWSCVFPIRVAGVNMLTMNQEDANTSTTAVCSCGSGASLKAGVTLEFWEPARIFEVVRSPHCYPSLGGIKLDPGFSAPEHARTAVAEGTSTVSFYQAHWYVNPILFAAEVLMDSTCLERGSFDVAYATEFDPLWDDDLLSFILAPDSALFANMIAQTACSADCIAATAGFGLNTLSWCAGCQGSVYPLTGWVPSHIGGVHASSLLMQKMTKKLHRQGLMWAGSGRQGLCSMYPQITMDKTNYKSQMLYPIPNTKKDAGRCCQPFGRSTVVWGSGKEFPYKGEDFSYQIFRKRACCSGAAVAPLVSGQ